MACVVKLCASWSYDQRAHLIDVQALSTSTIGSYLNAYYVNGNFNAASDLEGSYVEKRPPVLMLISFMAGISNWNRRWAHRQLG